MKVFLDYTQNVELNIRIAIFLGVLIVLTFIAAWILHNGINLIIRLGKKAGTVCVNGIRKIRLCFYDMRLGLAKSNNKRNQLIRAGNVLSEKMELHKLVHNVKYSLRWIKVIKRILVVVLAAGIVIVIAKIDIGVAEWLEEVYLEMEKGIKEFLTEMKW